MIGLVAGQRLSALALFAVVCMQITCQDSAVHGLTAKVLMTNDGPTILGANTTFTAKLIFENQTIEKSPSKRNAKSTQTFLYAYFWKQHICGDTNNVVEIEQNTTCNFTRTYSCQEDIGSHTVTLDVRENSFFFKPLVVSNSTTFQITEHINANLVIKQASCNSTSGLETCDVVATNKSVGMAVNIHDPSSFFKGAMLLFHWQFGDGFAQTTMNQPTISHMYKKPGHYGITVNMTAIFPDSDMLPKTGDVKHNLKTMDEIKNLTIHGKSDLKAGTKASYNISCHASLPVNFCWYVIPTTTHTIATDRSESISCNKTVLTNRTWLVVDHLFQKSGGYSVGVYASNAVSNSNSNKNVHADSSTNPPTVTGLVIGILFGIAGCFLSIAVLINYLRKQKTPNVEVANFDFQGRLWHRSTVGAKIRQFLFGGTSRENLPLSQDFKLNRSVRT